MKFVLRVFDTSGAVQTLRIDSDSSSTAASLARARGLRVVSVRADARRRRQGKNWAALPGGRFNVELFARELAALLDAGVGVVDALRTLGGNERREASAQVYRELLRLLEEGQSLSAALEHASRILAVEHPAWRVLVVDPGDMRTEMHQDAFPGEDISDRPEPAESIPGLLALVEGDAPSGRYEARAFTPAASRQP